MKKGNKVKIIGPCENEVSFKELKEIFPNLIGYINYISDGIIMPGETYVIIHPKYDKSNESYGWGFKAKNLKIL